VHFDGCVNIGIGGATKLLQTVVGSKIDGGFGPQTLKDVHHALKDNDAKAIALNIIDLRREYYRRIVFRNATQGVFLKGWLNRCNALQLAITHG
jgi:lysozyme family protein